MSYAHHSPESLEKLKKDWEEYIERRENEISSLNSLNIEEADKYIAELEAAYDTIDKIKAETDSRLEAQERILKGGVDPFLGAANAGSPPQAQARPVAPPFPGAPPKAIADALAAGRVLAQPPAGGGPPPPPPADAAAAAAPPAEVAPVPVPVVNNVAVAPVQPVAAPDAVPIQIQDPAVVYIARFAPPGLKKLDRLVALAKLLQALPFQALGVVPNGVQERVEQQIKMDLQSLTVQERNELQGITQKLDIATSPVQLVPLGLGSTDMGVTRQWIPTITPHDIPGQVMGATLAPLRKKQKFQPGWRISTQDYLQVGSPGGWMDPVEALRLQGVRPLAPINNDILIDYEEPAGSWIGDLIPQLIPGSSLVVDSNADGAIQLGSRTGAGTNGFVIRPEGQEGLGNVPPPRQAIPGLVVLAEGVDPVQAAQPVVGVGNILDQLDAVPPPPPAPPLPGAPVAPAPPPVVAPKTPIGVDKPKNPVLDQINMGIKLKPVVRTPKPVEEESDMAKIMNARRGQLDGQLRKFNGDLEISDSDDDWLEEDPRMKKVKKPYVSLRESNRNALK